MNKSFKILFLKLSNCKALTAINPTIPQATHLPERVNWNHPLISTHAASVPSVCVCVCVCVCVLLQAGMYLYWDELLNWIKRGFSFCTRILITFMKRRKFTWLGKHETNMKITVCESLHSYIHVFVHYLTPMDTKIGPLRIHQ